MTSITRDGRIEFRFYRPNASEVRIAGDFDGWSGGLRMRPQGQGWWQAELKLEPGEYRFRYVADGRWFTDFAANGIEQCKFGINSILLVPDATKSGSREAMPMMRLAA